MNSYTLIDENNWRRREHCAIYRHYVEPSYCMTVDLDVTNFLRTVRDEGYSFAMSLIWLVSRCANEIEEFRYRFLSERVVLFDRVDTYFAYMDEGDDLFKMVTVPFRDSLREFVTEATRTAKAQRVYFPSPPGIDVFQFAPIPPHPQVPQDYFTLCFPLAVLRKPISVPFKSLRIFSQCL